MNRDSLLLFFTLLTPLAGGCIETAIRPVKDPPDEGTPMIQVDPAAIDFGVIPAGESATGVITMSSVGSVALNVTAMQIDGDRATFTLLEPLIGTYVPNDSVDLTIAYSSDGGETSGALQILSNDPDSPNTSVSLLAHAEIHADTGETADTSLPLSQPIAECSVNPAEIETIHESADWIGNSSHDDDGSIIEYRWSLISSPDGATATMPAGGARRRNFIPDVAGEYIGELVVVDNDGLESEPCEATLTATAGEGLWVEIFWTNSGDDMDLHLLDNGGSLLTPSDCYYANCTWGGLNWGAGGPADDPILDLDDIPGTGPENINIDSPAFGTYTAYVHDYPGSIFSGRNDVTVNVYLGGALVWTDTRNVNSEGCYEPFVEVTVPGGATTDLSGSCR